jgi:hypothetical protein
LRRFGQFLLGLGAAVGVSVAIGMFFHLGLVGVPWLVNVALVKLGLVAAGGLMAGGAVSIRLAARREQRLLERPADR